MSLRLINALDKGGGHKKDKYPKKKKPQNIPLIRDEGPHTML